MRALLLRKMKEEGGIWGRRRERGGRKGICQINVKLLPMRLRLRHVLAVAVVSGCVTVDARRQKLARWLTAASCPAVAL